MVSLTLCQIAGEQALRARVPVAFGRGVDLVEALRSRLLQETGGTALAADARGAVASWPDAASAVAFAMRMQLGLLELEWPTTLVLRPQAADERTAEERTLYRGLRLRIGVHTGVVDECTDRRGRTIAVGPASHQPARVTHAARCPKTEHPRRSGSA